MPVRVSRAAATWRVWSEFAFLEKCEFLLPSYPKRSWSAYLADWLHVRDQVLECYSGRGVVPFAEKVLVFRYTHGAEQLEQATQEEILGSWKQTASGDEG